MRVSRSTSKVSVKKGPDRPSGEAQSVMAPEAQPLTSARLPSDVPPVSSPPEPPLAQAPLVNRLTFVTKRPGPGFPPGTYDASVFPPLLPDEVAMLYRDTINYANHRFRPALGTEVQEGLSNLAFCAETWLFREAEWDDRQSEEWAFQSEFLHAPVGPMPERWKDNIAVPILHALHDLGAMVPYEYGLVYLLLGCLERGGDKQRTVTEIRGLIRSWNLTMDPGTGRFSLSMLRLGLRGAAWWGRRPAREQAFQDAVIRCLLGALEGAVSSVSGQWLGGIRKADWNRAQLAMLQGSLAWSLPCLPAVERWLDRQQSHMLRAVAEPAVPLVLR